MALTRDSYAHAMLFWLLPPCRTSVSLTCDRGTIRSSSLTNAPAAAPPNPLLPVRHPSVCSISSFLLRTSKAAHGKAKVAARPTAEPQATRPCSTSPFFRPAWRSGQLVRLRSLVVCLQEAPFAPNDTRSIGCAELYDSHQSH